MSHESGLEYTGERHIPQQGGTIIALEHEHRYAFAQALVVGLTVVDIGCGEGYGAARLGTVAARVVGVDLDDESVTHAERTYGAGNVHFVVGDAARLPFGASSFDACIAFEVIEHVEEPALLLKEARRVLRPGGLVIVSTPNAALAHDADPSVNPFHRRVLTVEEFGELLAADFPSYSLLGQRVSGASFIWEMDAPPSPITELCSASASTRGAKYLIGVGRMNGPSRSGAHHASIYSDAESRVIEEHERLWTDLQWAKSQLDALETAVAFARDERAAFAKEADARLGEIERLQTMLTELARGQLSTETQLANALAELGSVERALAEAEAARLRLLADAERLRDERERAATELEKARRASDELERAQTDLRDARERAARLRGGLGSVLESRSWRLTRPFRRLRGSTRPELESLDELERG